MMILYRIGYTLFFFFKRVRRDVKIGWLNRCLTRLCNTYTYYFSLFCNRKMPGYYKKNPVVYGLNTTPRKERYIVSLTTFPARIDYLWLTIETLFRQKFKPDEVVLWLAEDQFPDHKIPESLEALKDKGLTVRFCDDLRSHKKYYYAFKEYADDVVILADDDLFFAYDTLYQLAKLHKKFPEDIIGISAQIIGPEMTSLPSVWPVAETYKKYYSTTCVQPFTGMGTLYPPHWYPDEIFNVEKIKRFAWSADDLWLMAMALINGVKVTKVRKFRAIPIDILNPHNEMLTTINNDVNNNLNDKVWQALIEEYNLEQYELK